MLTTALETGEGPGRRSLQASLLATVSRQVASAFGHEHVQPSKAKSRAPGESACRSAPGVHAGRNIESSLPKGYLVLPGTTRTSGLERRPGWPSLSSLAARGLRSRAETGKGAGLGDGFRRVAQQRWAGQGFRPTRRRVVGAVSRLLPLPLPLPGKAGTRHPGCLSAAAGAESPGRFQGGAYGARALPLKGGCGKEGAMSQGG